MNPNKLPHILARGLHLLVIAALLAGLALAVAPVPVAHAATTRTITVSNAADGASGGTSCTLRDAISAANAGATGTFNGCTISSSGSGTPITYVLNLPSYTYTLTGAAGEDLNASGDLDISANITINGAGQYTTIIDGGQIDRILAHHGWCDRRYQRCHHPQRQDSRRARWQWRPGRPRPGCGPAAALSPAPPPSSAPWAPASAPRRTWIAS